MDLKIPDSFSALSVFSGYLGRLRSGDTLHEDYVWRQEGLPDHKQLISVDGWNNFWPGVVSQLARIERLYWQSRRRAKIRRQRRLDLGLKMLQACPAPAEVLSKNHRLLQLIPSDAKIASAVPTHLGSKYPNQRWLFYFRLPSDEDVSHGITKVDWSFLHCEEEELPAAGISPELGQRFYQIDRGTRTDWSGYLRELLGKALIAYANKHLPPPQFIGHERSYRLKINGRTYFLKGTREFKDYTAYVIRGRPDEDDYQAIVQEPNRKVGLIARIRRAFKL